jgi:tetratricopeptide (TPR) repeat protein
MQSTKNSAPNHTRIILCLPLLLTLLHACNTLTWEDYMEAGYDALNDRRHEEAEYWFLAASDILDQFEPTDRRRAVTLNNLADLYVVQERLAEAELLFQNATDIIETSLGPDHLDVATQLQSVAAFYSGHGMHAAAEPLFARASSIRKAVLGNDSLVTNESNIGLASSYYYQGFHREAEPLYEDALHILERELPPDHVLIADVLEEYAGLLRATNRGIEALAMEVRVRQIRAAP